MTGAISALALLPPSHSQPAVTMPDKKKSISSRLRNSRDSKSGPASNTTGVVNDRRECTSWPFPQALTLQQRVHCPLKILKLEDK